MGLKLNSVNGKIEQGEWGSSPYRIPIHPIQICHLDHSVCGPIQIETFPINLYLVKSAQITGKVSQVELIMWTKLYCLVDVKIYKRNEQPGFFLQLNRDPARG